MGLLDWLRGGNRSNETPAADASVGRPEEHAGVDRRAGGDPQQDRVEVGTPEDAAEDTYHGPIDQGAEDIHQEERARHSGI